MGLKSGTNTLHGTAFALGRSTGMITRNPFFTAKPDTEFENYGATGGGVIKKDKLFFYGGFEGQLYSIGNPKTLIVPTTASLGGNKSNSLADAGGRYAQEPLGRTRRHPWLFGLGLAGCTPTPSGTGYSVTCTPGKGLFLERHTVHQFADRFSRHIGRHAKWRGQDRLPPRRQKQLQRGLFPRHRQRQRSGIQA